MCECVCVCVCTCVSVCVSVCECAHVKAMSRPVDGIHMSSVCA